MLGKKIINESRKSPKRFTDSQTHHIKKETVSFPRARKEDLENLTLTEHTESKRNDGEQRIVYLIRISGYIKRHILLRAIKTGSRGES